MYLSGCVISFVPGNQTGLKSYFGKGDGKQQQFLVIIKISTCEGSLAKINGDKTEEKCFL